MNRIKAIALDLDGTLTNSQKQITPRTREVLKRVQEMGVKIILASGRPVQGIAPLADELELDKYGGFVMAFNGGKLINWHTKEVLQNIALDAQFLPELYQSAMDYGMQILTVQGDKIAATDVADQYVHVEAFINKMELIEYDDFVRQVEHPINKCLIVGDPEVLPRVEATLSVQMSGRMDVYRSCPFFLECVPLGVNKGDAMRVLASHLQISTDEMMACGDSYNDMPMIEVAGVGVAMENGEEEVKKLATYVTLSNEEDGVAHAIEKFLNL